MARKIVVTSGKGGVGKTTIVMGLGLELARRGKKVLLVDCDFCLNNLDILFGVRYFPFDFCDVLSGICRINQAIQKHQIYPSLNLIASTKSKFGYGINKQMFQRAIDSLNDDYDYILLDCPSGVQENFLLTVNSADEALIVVNSQKQSLSVANKMISILNTRYQHKMGIIINNVRWDLVENRKLLSPYQIGSMLGASIVGTVSHFDEIETAGSLYGQINFFSGEIRSQFEELAENVEMGKSCILKSCEHVGVFQKMKNVFKRRI